MSIIGMTCSGGEPRGAVAMRNLAATMAERLAVPTTARSMPPDIMVRLMPIDMRPYSGNCRIIELMLVGLRKRFGLSADMRANTRTRKTRSLAMLRSTATLGRPARAGAIFSLMLLLPS